MPWRECSVNRRQRAPAPFLPRLQKPGSVRGWSHRNRPAAAQSRPDPRRACCSPRADWRIPNGGDPSRYWMTAPWQVTGIPRGVYRDGNGEAENQKKSLQSKGLGNSLVDFGGMQPPLFATFCICACSRPDQQMNSCTHNAERALGQLLASF